MKIFGPKGSILGGIQHTDDIGIHSRKVIFPLNLNTMSRIEDKCNAASG